MDGRRSISELVAAVAHARSRYFSKQSLCWQATLLPTFHGSGAHDRVSPFPLIGKHKVGSPSRTPLLEKQRNLRAAALLEPQFEETNFTP